MKLFFLLLVAILAAFPQTPPPSPSTPAPSPAPTPTPTPTPSFPTSPSFGGAPQQPGSPNAHPIWLDLAVSGRVLLEDGAPSPEPVAVSLACIGPKSFTEPSRNRATLTDLKGNFSLTVGLNITSGSPNTRAGSLPRLQGCSVEIQLPGYAPWRKDLGRLVSLSDFDLGAIQLKRTARGGAGSTISKTSAQAPEKARLEYAAAINDIYSHNYSQALARLDKAIAVYPNYAAANYLAGYVLDLQARPDLAAERFRRSAAADPNYVNPILQLAQIAAAENNYPEAARLARRAIELLPEAYGEMYLIAAGAHFNLGHLTEAESTARAAITAGLDASAPRLHLLLAETLWKQNKRADARQEYLRFADLIREGPEADAARARAASR